MAASLSKTDAESRGLTAPQAGAPGSQGCCPKGWGQKEGEGSLPRDPSPSPHPRLPPDPSLLRAGYLRQPTWVEPGLCLHFFICEMGAMFPAPQAQHTPALPPSSPSEVSLLTLGESRHRASGLPRRRGYPPQPVFTATLLPLLTH